MKFLNSKVMTLKEKKKHFPIFNYTTQRKIFINLSAAFIEKQFLRITFLSATIFSMSSSTYLDDLRFAIQQINIYVGLFVFITGIFGEIFNIIIFSTLKIFRQTTCSFYLITASIINIDVLISVFLRIIYDGFNLGLPYTPLYCKCWLFIAQYGVSMSLTSMCFAIIDQFISMTKFKQWNQLRTAYCLVAVASVLWFIAAIFNFIYYDSNGSTCIMTNTIYATYYAYVHSAVLIGFLPLTIMIIFSVLAFFKIRTTASRQINIVRLSRDRQLTAMTLFHVLYIIITSIVFLTFTVYSFVISTTNEIEIARDQFISATTLLFYYTNFSVRSFLQKYLHHSPSFFILVVILYLLLCIKTFS
jgi:hypothetical protein